MSSQAAYRTLAGKQALVILDGAEDATDLKAVLDVTTSCGVLITSRKRSDAVAERQDIAPLVIEEAVTLLQAWGQAQLDDRATSEQICELVGRLPLAVRLVGRYLTESSERAKEYLTWLQATPLQALDYGERRDKSVPHLIERSLSQVSEEASAVLAVTGLLALASFDREVIAAALPEVNARWALGELIRYGLLLRPQERYEISHALIHTYARRRLAAPGEVVERVAGYYTELSEQQSQLGPKGYARLDGERAHIMTVLTRCVEREQWEAGQSLVWGVTNYLHIQGHWLDWVKMLELGLRAVRGLNHRRDEGALLGNLGIAYSDLGQVEQAIAYHQQALDIAREIGDRQSEGNQLGNLGIAYHALGQVKQAIAYHQQALEISREIGDRQNEGFWLGNLGNAYRDLGQVKQAIDYYQQALEISREIGDRRSEGAQLGNLGSAYRDLGQVEQAIDYYQQALGITSKIGNRRSEVGWLGKSMRGEGYIVSQEIEKLIINYDRRLQKLKQSKALQGLSTDPKILLEIEDIEAEIKRLQAELEQSENPVGDTRKRQIEISLEADFSKLSSDVRTTAIRSLARLLNIPEERIRMIEVRKGSVILRLELPQEAAERLMELHEAGKSIILDLGIQKAKVTNVRYGQKPQIFLCYSREDENRVEELFEKLTAEGFKPWMAKKSILPGEYWESSIKRAIKQSEFFIACLSRNSVI